MGRKSKTAIATQKKWEDRISRAKQVRKTWKDLFRVQLALEYLDGKQRPPEYPSGEWITVNKVYTHLKALLPALYSADPYFFVTLKRSFTPLAKTVQMYEKLGKIRASYLNYLKDELGLKEKARLAIQDAMFSIGVLRVEHHSTMVENPDAGARIMAGEDEDAEPMLDDQGQEMLEPDLIPVESRYGIERVHPDDFIFDEDASTLESSWGWVAERMRVPYEEIESNPLFKRSAVKSLKGKGEEKGEEEQDRERRKKGTDLAGGSDIRKSAFADVEKEVLPEVCTLWKIWDLKKKKWLIIGEGGEEPLLDEDKLPPGVERHPYAILRFTLRDDSPWPIPPMSQGIDVSKEYNIARSDLLKHRKRFNRKYQAYIPGLAGDDELGKLEVGDDGTIIKCQQPGAVITPIQDAPLDQMRYQEIGALNNDMIELFGGTSDEARGIAGADSATQAGILDQRLQMKEGDAMSQVVDMIKILARKLDQLVQAHIEAVEVVRVTGLSGDFVEIVRPEDYAEINGEFQYDVNVGSTMPRLPQMERASWMAFLQLIANAPFLGQSKRLLTRMAELHHIDDESMVEELGKALTQMAQMMAAGKGGGQQGSLPNTSEANPVAAVGGQTGGAAGAAESMGG